MTSKTKAQFFFHIISIFPQIFDPYLQFGVIGRAVKRGLIGVKIHNLRDFSDNKKKGRVDGRPFGGGPGMVLEALPVVRAVEKIKGKSKKKIRVLIMAAGGKPFTNALAERLARNSDELILVAGRYEGIDARVRRMIPGAIEVSVGPYVLTGGELPALTILDAVARRLPGVLGDELSVEEKRIASSDTYTRPEVITHRGRKFRVPKVLLSGNHQKIDNWRKRKTSKNK